MLEAELFENMIKSAETLKKASNKILSEIGVTHGQAQILHYLCLNRDKKITLKDIETRFSLSHATVSGVVDRMVQKGLLVTKQDEADRRCRLVMLAETDDEHYEKTRSHIDFFLKRLREQMSDEEQRRLISLTDKFVKIVESSVNQYISLNKESLS